MVSTSNQVWQDFGILKLGHTQRAPEPFEASEMKPEKLLIMSKEFGLK